MRTLRRVIIKCSSAVAGVLMCVLFMSVSYSFSVGNVKHGVMSGLSHGSMSQKSLETLESTPSHIRSTSGMPAHSSSAPSKKVHKVGQLDLYDLTAESRDAAQCYPLRIKPAAKICVHNDKEDIYVSKDLRIHGIWEQGTVSLFQQALLYNSSYHVVDIGANLGLYSLTAAAMGRKVIAVEPLVDNIRHFHKSVQLNKFQDCISLVTNAISNKHEKVFFKTYTENKGGTSMWEGKDACKRKNNCPYAMSVYMDDFVPLFQAKNITTAIMKMDIEGAEHLAMSRANKFFSTVDISMIFMEVAIQRMYCGAQGPDTEDKRLTNKMLDFLKQQGFTKVYSLGSGHPKLDPNSCSKQWPRDVLWVKEKVNFPH